MYRIYAFWCVSVIFLLNCTSQGTQEKSKYNVLFILADDLGYHDLGCYGSKLYETKHLDALAEDGTRFVNGYAACQVCSPSRASIMTGKFPSNHGITDWIGAKVGEDWRQAKRHTKSLPPAYVRQLSADDVTMAEYFKKSGYRTFFAGKWHLGGEGSYPEDHGFDENQGGFEAGGPYTGGYFSPFNNPKMKDYPNEKGMHLSLKLAKETSKFIERSKHQPFLAFLSFYAVHAPIQTSEEKWGHFRQKVEEQGYHNEGFAMERRLPIRKYQDDPVYAGLVQQMDEGVGEVINKLKSLGIYDNTIIVFTSDNGGVASGDNYATSNAPLRGGKGYQWEGGLKVPYILKAPQIQASSSDLIVSGVDFLPTLLALSQGYSVDYNDVDGIDFSKSIGANQISSRSLYWHYPHYGNQGGDPSSVLRKGQYKLIYYHEDEHKELYDIFQDPEEVNDIASMNSKLTEDLFSELMDHLTKREAKFAALDPMFDQDSLDMKQQFYRTKLKERLEEQRLKKISKDWKPNENWWGSTID